jgi:kinesin family member 2/24
MIDRDTLRLQGRDKFIEGIKFWRGREIEEVVSITPSSSISVCVRKRPIFDREIANGEFDVVTVLPPGRIVTHNCQFHADLKRAYLTHSEFEFTQCFGETASNESVFECAQKICSNSGVGTIFMFGQTGSGKTHTMTSIEDRVAELLLGSEDPPNVSLTFIELAGKKVLDLLREDKASVRLRERPDGSMLAEGASVVAATSAEHLKSLMRAAHERRHTQSTDANSTSSRSHAVCILDIQKGDSSTSKLLLVDLAGSERRKDSMYHDRERQREGAEINASLHALKECIRWKAAGGQSNPPPYRLSNLTRVLAETFIDPNSSLCVIATVSPCATDIEHTISTLKTVHGLTDGRKIRETKQDPLLPPASRPVRPATPPHPKNWNSEHIATWLSRDMAESDVALPKATTGAMLVRMSETRFVQMCAGDERRGGKLFRDLHDRMRKG